MLAAAVQESGLSGAVAERARQLERPGVSPIAVTLPGFHLFTVSGSPAPYAWLAPKPRGDMFDFINLWEAFVNNPISARPRRDTVMSPILRERAVLSPARARAFFGGPRREAGRWAAPAAKLIAMAQHFEGQGELSVDIQHGKHFHEARLRRVTLRLADYVLSVGPGGMWSNTERRDVNHGVRGSEFAIDELCIRPLRTSHPLAVALLECEEMPAPALHALNVALRGSQIGLVRKDEIRVRKGVGRLEAVAACVTDALGHLDSDVAQPLRGLYDVLVPAAVSSREFRSVFGDPFRETTACRGRTRERLRAQVAALRP